MSAARRAALRSATLESNNLISLLWSDGLRRTFHPLWLRDQCPSRRHPGTRQKLFSAADVPPLVRATTTEATDDVLRVQWEPDHASSYCATWLRSHGTADAADADGSATANDDEAAVVSAAKASAPPDVYTVDFDELLGGGEDARWRWLRALSEDGATLLRGVPEHVTRAADNNGGGVDGVRFVAELIGPLQPNIYGDIFDVVSKGDDAENLAYTTEAIGPHMDLCYYESPPGLQLLHCLAFDQSVTGGGSLLIDSFRVAEALRDACPTAFNTLTTIPATFLKDHSRRAHPVLLSYQRPHIATDPRSSRVTGVFWSPPFEGPLIPNGTNDVSDYYLAYRLLHRAIEEAPRWERRLQPSEMLVFNNRRMLHGRHGFESNGGMRHLRGCYVNIDEYANALNLLNRAFLVNGENGDGGVAACPGLGNQDWALGPIELPSEKRA